MWGADLVAACQGGDALFPLRVDQPNGLAVVWGETGVFVHVHVSVFSRKYCKQRYWFLQIILPEVFIKIILSGYLLKNHIILITRICHGIKKFFIRFGWFFLPVYVYLFLLFYLPNLCRIPKIYGYFHINFFAIKFYFK